MSDMKIWLFIGLLVAGGLFLWGCDSSGSMEEGEGLGEVERVRLIFRAEDGAGVEVVDVRGEALIGGGVALEADTVRFLEAKTYAGDIHLFDGNGKEVTRTIRLEPEAYQFFYTMEGVEELEITATDTEFDYNRNEVGNDLPVGLTYSVTVPRAPLRLNERRGNLHIQLGHFEEQPKDGVHLNGSPLLDFVVPVAIDLQGPDSPGPFEDIGQVRVQIGRVGLRSQGGPNGLNAGDTLGTTLGLRAQNLYEGSIQLYGPQGADITEEFWEERNWHQVFFEPLDSLAGAVEIKPTDEDSYGRPVGLNFTVFVPPNLEVVEPDGIRFQLGHYVPSQGEYKDGETLSSQTDLDFIVPIRVFP